MAAIPFSSTSVFGTATTDQGWYLLDAKRTGDRTYVLYSDVSDLYGHVAKDYVMVVPDSGAKLGPYMVSVPAKNGSHYATIWQGNNYSPKIAVSADKAYVVFGCQDANNVERATMRRFTNYGASLDPTVITSDTDPDGNVNEDDVSVAANSNYAMMVYHVDTSDALGGINKIVVKRYSESAQAAVPATPLFNKQSYYRGSIYPTIMAGSGQNAYVMWQTPTLTRSADSFNSCGSSQSSPSPWEPGVAICRSGPHGSKRLSVRTARFTGWKSTDCKAVKETRTSSTAIGRQLRLRGR